MMDSNLFLMLQSCGTIISSVVIMEFLLMYFHYILPHPRRGSNQSLNTGSKGLESFFSLVFQLGL